MKIDFPIPDLPLNSYEMPKRISGRYLALEHLENAAHWKLRINPIGVARAVSRVVTTLQRVAEVNGWYDDEEYHPAPRWSCRWHYCHECACDGRGTHTCTRENRAQGPCAGALIEAFRFELLTFALGELAPSCSAGDVAYIEGIRTRQAEVYDRLAYHQRGAAWA